VAELATTLCFIGSSIKKCDDAGSNPVLTTKNKTIMKLVEKDLEIYDVWESPIGNLFIKISDDYSLGIGPKGNHEPLEESGDMERTQYVKSNNITPVKKIGKIIFE